MIQSIDRITDSIIVLYLLYFLSGTNMGIFGILLFLWQNFSESERNLILFLLQLTVFSTNAHHILIRIVSGNDLCIDFLRGIKLGAGNLKHALIAG